jgi:hypothetical protein
VKIGSYSVPDIRLFPSIVDMVSKIYENYELNEPPTEEAFGQLLGHKSVNSGAYRSKLADIRLYGLLESRSLKVTPLAERLTHGTELEKQTATNKAILSVPLWNELYSKFGVEVPDSNFWVQLQRITGVSHLEAQKHADSVRKAYLDDISHIKAIKTDTQRGKDKMGGRIDISLSTISIQAGPFSQNVPWTDEGIELGKSFLEILKAQSKKKEDTVKKETTEEG